MIRFTKIALENIIGDMMDGIYHFEQKNFSKETIKIQVPNYLLKLFSAYHYTMFNIDKNDVKDHNLIRIMGLLPTQSPFDKIIIFVDDSPIYNELKPIEIELKKYVDGYYAFETTNQFKKNH